MKDQPVPNIMELFSRHLFVLSKTKQNKAGYQSEMMHVTWYFGW